MKIRLILIATMLLSIPIQARASDELLVRHCEIAYDRVTTLGAFVLVQAGGRVQDCYVRPGDRVKAGQVLGRLHDRDAVHELERLKRESEADIDERLGRAKHDVAVVKHKRAEILRQRGAISDEELLLASLAVTTAELEIEAAQHRRRGDTLIRKRMEAEVRSREFICPHDGVVVEIIKNVGESCICNEPVMKIVHDDVLWVSGNVDVGDAWKVKAGQSVRVHPEIEGADVDIESEVFFGTIFFVDPRIDPLTRSCKVTAEVKNRDRRLRAGIEGSLVIDFDSGSDAPKAVGKAGMALTNGLGLGEPWASVSKIFRPIRPDLVARPSFSPGAESNRDKTGP